MSIWPWSILAIFCEITYSCLVIDLVFMLDVLKWLLFCSFFHLSHKNFKRLRTRWYYLEEHVLWNLFEFAVLIDDLKVLFVTFVTHSGNSRRIYFTKSPWFFLFRYLGWVSLRGKYFSVSFPQNNVNADLIHGVINNLFDISKSGFYYCITYHTNRQYNS